MTQAKAAERAHELVTAEVERSTKQYTDTHGRPLPAHDIAAGIVLKLVMKGLLRDDIQYDEPAAALPEKTDYVFVDRDNVYHRAVRQGPDGYFGPACPVSQFTAYVPSGARRGGHRPCPRCMLVDDATPTEEGAR
jgi:hypothetical protein